MIMTISRILSFVKIKLPDNDDVNNNKSSSWEIRIYYTYQFLWWEGK